MTHRRLFVALALVASLLLAGCASGGPSAETTDIFQAAPWASGEELTYQVLSSDLEVMGTGVLSSEVVESQIALVQRYVEGDTPAGLAPVMDEITVFVNPSTLRPERGTRIAHGRADNGTPTYDRWEWQYGANEDGEPTATFQHFDAEDDDDPSERTLRLRAHYYDNESSLWLWRSVNLIEEFEAFYVSVNAMERNQQTVSLRVPQTEMITVPAGEFEAYRLLFRNGRAVRTAWIEAAEPHRVLRWDNGSSILELLR
jgi:hypothetical protein